MISYMCNQQGYLIVNRSTPSLLPSPLTQAERSYLKTSKTSSTLRTPSSPGSSKSSMSTTRSSSSGNSCNTSRSTSLPPSPPLLSQAHPSLRIEPVPSCHRHIQRRLLRLAIRRQSLSEVQPLSLQGVRHPQHRLSRRYRRGRVHREVSRPSGCLLLGQERLVSPAREPRLEICHTLQARL
jgi:hypothetical protein